MTARATITAAPKSRMAVALVLLISALVVAWGAFHVSRKKEQIRVGYDLSRIQKRLSAAAEHNRQLRLEKSVLTAPARIERLARQLGMTRTMPGQVRVVRSGKQVAKAP